MRSPAHLIIVRFYTGEIIEYHYSAYIHQFPIGNIEVWQAYGNIILSIAIEIAYAKLKSEDCRM